MDSKPTSAITKENYYFINGGEMGALIRAYPWHNNLLGPISKWPQSLKTIVSTILHSPVPLVILCGEKGIMIYNDAYSIFAGKRHPFLLGSKVEEGWPEVAAFNRNVLDTVLQGNTLSYNDQKLTLYRNNVAEEVWMNLNYSAILDEIENPIGVLAIVVETTQRVIAENKQKEAEESLITEQQKLLESEEHLRALVTATSDVIYVMSNDWSEMGLLDGRVFVPDVGRPRNDWFTSNIPVSDQPQVRKAIDEAILNKSIFYLEHRVKLANGDIGWTSSRAIPILDSNNNIIKWFGAATDITQRKLAEESLYQKNQQLTKINQDLDNFIYTASHDLKAPISNIEGLFNTLLSEVELKEDLISVKDMIQKSFEQFRIVIKDLTEITKAQKGDFDDIESISLTELIDDIKLSIYNQITDHQARITLNLEVKNVSFSKKNLRSVLYNLILNSIKYSSTERIPEIKINSVFVNECILITISDNGLGISVDNQKKLFKMFKRFHDHVEGSGIGLYIVKNLIDNAGGRIEVESAIDHGTTFKVYIPQAAVNSV